MSQHRHPHLWPTTPYGPSESSLETLFGLGPPRSLYHHLLLGSDKMITQFSVIQYVASKGDLQWSTWVNKFVSRTPSPRSCSSGPRYFPDLLPEKQSPLSLSWNVVRMQQSPIAATVNKSRMTFFLNSWDGKLPIPKGTANVHSWCAFCTVGAHSAPVV